MTRIPESEEGIPNILPSYKSIGDFYESLEFGMYAFVDVH